jgi:hypothetical protein
MRIGTMAKDCKESIVNRLASIIRCRLNYFVRRSRHSLALETKNRAEVNVHLID